jgi:hypothetical protein
MFLLQSFPALSQGRAEPPAGLDRLGAEHPWLCRDLAQFFLTLVGVVPLMSI